MAHGHAILRRRQQRWLGSEAAGRDRETCPHRSEAMVNIAVIDVRNPSFNLDVRVLGLSRASGSGREHVVKSGGGVAAR
ncbi:hypothetical protein [Streptomyces sp. NPDC059479]|uniref:hypothetical protein n=1 Tax=Streptomyces sp. NPDC059479 TaxID=3346848 RepID=UPI0036B97CCC